MSDFLPPSIPPRRDFTAKFVSFGRLVDFNSWDRIVVKWERDRRLERKLNTLVRQDKEFRLIWDKKEEYSVLIELLQRWNYDSREDKIFFQNCIYSYLEEPRYRAAYNRFLAYHDFENPQESWDKYISTSGLLTLDFYWLLSVLNKYNSSYGTRLIYFLSSVLERKIAETYYKEEEKGKYSDFFLLKRASNLRIKKGLMQIIGLSQKQAYMYIFARDALFEVYQKPGRRWLPPTQEEYKAGVDFFNRHYPDRFSNFQPIDTDWFERAIETCLQAIKTPQLLYIDDLRNIELIEDNLEVLSLENPIDSLSDKEFQKIINQLGLQLRELLVSTLDNFSEEEIAILRLRYGKKMSGAKIGKILGKNQSNVSRTTHRCLRKILETIVEWAYQKYPEIDVKKIKFMQTYVKEWIEEYYSEST